MVILHVTVQIKPEHMAEYLEAVRHDAEHSAYPRTRMIRIGSIITRSIKTRRRWKHTGKRPISNSMRRKSRRG